MLRKISVFVKGLLPDFFAIADSSKTERKIVCGRMPTAPRKLG
jgi:hypothetical protein